MSNLKTLHHDPSHPEDDQKELIGLENDSSGGLTYIQKRQWHHDPSHPEYDLDDLIMKDKNFSGDIAEIRKKQGRIPEEYAWPAEDENKVLCRACGWTNYHQSHGAYAPRIKMMHARTNMGLWDLGGQWVLRDEPNDKSQGNDFITQQWIRDQGVLANDIPLPKKALLISEPDDKVCFTLTKMVPGERLLEIWHTQTPEQKEGYICQMVACLKAMRQFTRPTAQKVDGTLIDDWLLGYCWHTRSPTCSKIGSNNETWFDNLEPTLRGGLSNIHKTNDTAVIDEKLAELKANFPSGGPYVLTHGDLNLSNIMVKDGKITGIIDWEHSGFLPWWVERQTSIFCYDPAYELIGPMWERLQPEMSRDEFRSRVLKPVNQVEKAWEQCNVDHPGIKDQWQVPAFSNCEPRGGYIRWTACGNQVEHRINPLQWGAKRQNKPFVFNTDL